MKFARIIIALIVVLAFGQAISFAQEAEVELQNVTVTATAEGITLPEDLALVEGLITFTFDNQNEEAPLLPVPARLKDDVTFEDLNEVMMSESPDAAMGLVLMYGGTFINPLSTVEVTYELPAGTYLLMDLASGAPVMLPFEVTAAEEAVEEVELEADLTVSLIDFGFGIPAEIEAGEGLWHIINAGAQWHEMAIVKVEDGATLEEALEVVSNLGPESDIMPNFLWVPMEAETEAYVNVNLEPGTYIVGCFLPDVTEEVEEGQEPHAHFELGMIQIITVQ